MFAIIISFTIIASGAHGEGVMTDQQFVTMAECEAARPAKVLGFRTAVEFQHGRMRIESRCARADALDHPDTPA